MVETVHYFYRTPKRKQTLFKQNYVREINYFNRTNKQIIKREWVVNFIFKILQDCTSDLYT